MEQLPFFARLLQFAFARGVDLLLAASHHIQRRHIIDIRQLR